MKKVSVIIPVYNTMPYLARCLDSVVKQSYPNLEIIIVDDCSPDGSLSIIKKYMDTNNRIKLIQHERNRGLFAARRSGLEAATGDYIACIDSDDFVSKDLFRVYMEEAQQSDADIIFCRQIFYHEHNQQCNAVNPQHNPSPDLRLEGQDIMDAFYNQEGQYYYWHVIWNKLYKRSLFDAAMPYYRSIEKPITMTEDMLYSSVLFFYAKKVTAVDIDGVFYVQRDDSATGEYTNSLVKKHTADIAYAFHAMETFLQQQHVHEQYAQRITEWKKVYWKHWDNSITEHALDSSLSSMFRKNLHLKKTDTQDVQILGPSSDAQFAWDGRLEQLRELILSAQFTHISFDIFDTLVVRPFYEPSDLFMFLNELFSSILDSNSHYDFRSVRQEAELLARQAHSAEDDITIDDIYSMLGKLHHLDTEKTNILKEREKALEIAFCRQRKTMKSLYDLALSIGKTVIIVSDMYLDRDTISAMLKKNGYNQYHKLYISSETKKTKASGKMYQHVIRDLGVSPQHILHIGDDHANDVAMAEKYHMASFHMPKCIERLQHVSAGNTNGQGLSPYLYTHNHGIDYTHAQGFLMIRCMLGIIANHIFDNGYRSFNPNSDFSGDPEIIGYFPLGMHILSTCSWIAQDALKAQYDTIHFIARDGWAYQIVYDMYAKHNKQLPRSSYFYASRISLMPIIRNTKKNFSLAKNFINIYSHSPEQFAKIVLQHTLTDAEIKLIKKQLRISLKDPFVSVGDFHAFVDICAEHNIGEQTAQEALALIKLYCEQNISKNDALFDVGYNGTTAQLLAILGYPMDSYFIHSNWEIPYTIMRMHNKEIKTLYPYKPTITGPIRETLISETNAQCIGYRKGADNAIIPVFSDDIPGNHECDIIHNVQSAAYRFAEDFLETFSDYLPILFARNCDGSVTLENFFAYPKEPDMAIFKHILFENFTDTGVLTRTSVAEMWREDLRRCHMGEDTEREHTHIVFQPVENAITIPILGKSKITRLLLYIFWDRSRLKGAILHRGKKYLRGYPTLYRMARSIVLRRRNRRKRLRNRE